MKELIKGANTPLAASGRVQIRLLWRTAPGELDLACFALNTREHVPGDDWFVFYNQPASPHGAIRLDPSRAAFLINLDALPAVVSKCVFTATLSQGGFHEVVDATFISAPTVGDHAARFRLTESAANCRSMLIAEIYRYQDAWKVRAKGEGLPLDLAGLSRLFGVDVLDETPSVRPLAPPPPVPRPTPAPAPMPLPSGQPSTTHPPVPASPPIPVPVPASPPIPVPVPASPPIPVPVPASPPIPVPVPASPPVPAPAHPPMPAHPAGSPHLPIDRHEKLKTVATVAIALGSLTTAITTVVTQCAPHAPVVVVQAPPAPPAIQQPAPADANPNNLSPSGTRPSR